MVVGLAVVSASLDFRSGLAVDAGPAQEAGHGVAAGASLDAVPVARLSTEEKQRNTGNEASEEAVEEAALAEVVGVAVQEARRAERTAAT